MPRPKKTQNMAEASAQPTPLADDRERLSQLASNLLDLDPRQLQLQWRNRLGGTAPAHLPTWLLSRLLAYRIRPPHSAI